MAEAAAQLEAALGPDAAGSSAARGAARWRLLVVDGCDSPRNSRSKRGGHSASVSGSGDASGGAGDSDGASVSSSSSRYRGQLHAELQRLCTRFPGLCVLVTARSPLSAASGSLSSPPLSFAKTTPAPRFAQPEPVAHTPAASATVVAAAASAGGHSPPLQALSPSSSPASLDAPLPALLHTRRVSSGGSGKGKSFALEPAAGRRRSSRRCASSPAQLRRAEQSMPAAPASPGAKASGATAVLRPAGEAGDCDEPGGGEGGRDKDRGGLGFGLCGDQASDGGSLESLEDFAGSLPASPPRRHAGHGQGPIGEHAVTLLPLTTRNAARLFIAAAPRPLEEADFRIPLQQLQRMQQSIPEAGGAPQNGAVANGGGGEPSACVAEVVGEEEDWRADTLGALTRHPLVAELGGNPRRILRSAALLAARKLWELSGEGKDDSAASPSSAAAVAAAAAMGVSPVRASARKKRAAQEPLSQPAAFKRKR